MKSGFTLIELLVVVAIIAVVGAGVAVTYSRLDERAKVAMEISDISALEKTIGHWSFLHNGNLPNKLDSLITTDGSSLYSAMTGTSGNGLGMQAGFTFAAAPADNVISALTSVGIDTVYMHDPSVSPANDSTFKKPASTMAVNKLDVSETKGLLGTSTDIANKIAQANAIVAANSDAVAALTKPDNYDADDQSTHGSYTGSYTVTWDETNARGMTTSASKTFTDLAAWVSAYNDAREVGQPLNTLAFLYPDGGTQMGMNLAYEIISNAGLDPARVADPNKTAEENATAGKQYWLVAFGIGRFASLYEGNGARIESPVAGKRYPEGQYYNRYLMLVKIPVSSYNNMTGQSAQKATVATVLSPIGLSKARLDNTYRDAVTATEG